MAKKAIVENAPVPLASESRLVETEGTEIRKFVANVAVFLRTAAGLEQRAKETRKAADVLRQPKTLEQDQAVKEFVRIASLDKKEVEGHWEITTVFSRFHKRLTAARNRAVEPLEQAVAIGTQLHSSYVRAEQQRAQEEQDRRRREEEARVQAQRDKDLADIEKEACRLEEASPTLSDREQRFVDAYILNGGNAQRAAQAAGYKELVGSAARLTTNKKILAAIEAKQKAQAARQQAAAVREQPLEVKTVTVAAQVDTGGDRETKSAEVLDEAAFIAAVVEGKFGIPLDVLTVRPVKLNEYARSLGPLINRWPGIRLKTKTSII